MKCSDAFNQAGFVELIGYFVDNDGKTSITNFFNGSRAAHC